MPVYEVTFDDVGFGCEPDAFAELTQEQIAELTGEWLNRQSFPDGVIGLVGATLSVDDSVYDRGEDEDGDVKCFVSVCLLVEANEYSEAESMDNPDRLLRFVANKLDSDVDLEGNWEVLDCTIHESMTSLAPA